MDKLTAILVSDVERLSALLATRESENKGLADLLLAERKDLREMMNKNQDLNLKLAQAKILENFDKGIISSLCDQKIEKIAKIKELEGQLAAEGLKQAEFSAKNVDLKARCADLLNSNSDLNNRLYLANEQIANTVLSPVTRKLVADNARQGERCRCVAVIKGSDWVNREAREGLIRALNATP